MKKSYLLSIFIACVVFIMTSCDGDDDKKGSDSIIGSWVWKSWVTVECDDPDELFDSDGCADGDCYVFTFNSDGTFYGDYDGEVSGTYELNGDKLSMSESSPFESDVSDFIVTFEENRMMLTSDGVDPFSGCVTRDTFTKQ